ncbi:MATE family efflux transporter [Clostridium chauvoei]|uniref:MATE family efflux transporter n=1 Tax=Clostridium chauvoei TaxID=46867 RepID=UPI001C841859|nr:MATE family efflux transporter [Clostridium chauvoei]MBX7307755.1 MATE family efflux transporter [Clostridium chauvoei]MBX7352997.1 MATE family efflux transporter [Clostridium chauvoei]
MNRDLDLGKESIGKLFLKYSIPSVIGTLIFSIYIVIDGIFIGRAVGSSGLAAINIAMPFFSTSFAISLMVSVGGSTITSIELGQGDKEKARNTFSLAFYSLLSISIIASIITILFTKEIAIFLGATGELIKPVCEYLAILALFLPVFTCSGYLASGLRTIGKPNYSMICNIVGSVLNIILDYIMVIELNMGVFGAALASGIAFAVAFIVAILGYFNKNSVLKFVKCKVDLKKVGRFFYNGSSEALAEFAFAFSTYLFNIVLINRLGEMGVSAFSIIQYIASLVVAVFLGISTGISPIISYNYGAKNNKRIGSITKISLVVMTALGIICTTTLFVGGEGLIRLFVDGDEALIETTIGACKIYSTCFLISGINILASAYFTALEDAKTSIIISMLRGIIFISIGIIILSLFLDINGVWLTVTFAELMTVIISYRLMKKSYLSMKLENK